VGLWNFLTREPKITFASATGVGSSLLSPWSDQSGLVQVLIDEAIGGPGDIVTRETAMRVPAIARARSLIVGSIADLPMYAYRADEKITRQPTWCYRTSGPLSIWHRWAATLDDLFFHGMSLWARENGADGFPVDYMRVPWHRWETNEGRILVDGRPVQDNQVTFIPGPAEGILQSAGDTIRGARAIDDAWIKRVQSPMPIMALEQTEDDGVTQREVENALEQWAAARKNGGTGFVPYGLRLNIPTPSDDSAMFIEGRNAVRLDIANFANIPASLLDGSTATASLTYTTTEGQRSSFHEQTLRYWMAPLEHRLSQDDVVPKGQRVRFDITFTTPVAPTGEPGED